MSKTRYDYRDPQPYARVVVILQWIYLAAIVFNVAVVFAIFGGVQQAVSVASLSDFGTAGGYVISGIAFLVWTYRVVANARNFKPGINASPGWAIGWYFVPVAYLWKPFEYLEETWRVSTDLARPASVGTPALLRWWWGLWLAATVLGYVGTQMSRIDASEGSMTSVVITLISQLLRVPLVILLIRIVTQLTERQVKTHAGAGAAEVFT